MGPQKGEIVTVVAKIDIFYQTKMSCIKKGYGMTMISSYTTHMTFEYIKIQNTLVIGAQGGGKLSPFVLTTIRLLKSFIDLGPMSLRFNKFFLNVSFL